jgi:uncharacterized membrane protein YfcA
VPLLIYVVGVASPHVAIGTSSIAVALSALANLVGHARAGNVRWPCVIVFSIAGMTGAAVGSAIGKSFDGQKLLLLFGVLMIVIAATMILKKEVAASTFQTLGRVNAARMLPRLLGAGGAVGLLSGFFGIGGGFLIVPGLMASVEMPMILAVGSSLVAVAAFGATTAISYAMSGLVDWRLAGIFILGGVFGGLAGTRLACVLADRKSMLTRLFAGIVMFAGVYMVARGVIALKA